MIDANGRTTDDGLRNFLGTMQDSVFLSTEEIAQLRVAVVEVPDEASVLEGALPLEQQGNWDTRHDYTKVDKFGTPTISDVPGDADALVINGSQVTTQLVFVHLDYELKPWEVNKARELGEPLNTKLAKETAIAVQRLVDRLIYSHTTTPFGNLGIYDQFTGAHVAAGVWSAANPDAIHNDIVGAVTAIPARYVQQSMVLLLNNINRQEMAKVNSFGLNALTQIQQTYPQLKILVSEWVTEGTALLYPFRSDVAYLVTGHPLDDFSVSSHNLIERRKVLRSLIPIVAAPTAGIKISNI